MQKMLIFGLILSVSFSILPSAFAENIYKLTVDEHSFDLTYEFSGDVIAMAIDQELRSLLIGVENTKDSLFRITFDNKLISATNDNFAILVNGLEVDYDILDDGNSSTLRFYVEEGTEEIEIIGTHVIPEFPFSVFFGFVLMTSIVLIITKFRIFR
ncbi:MAG: conserved exported protein of unknown function [Nitrosopumilales archaeon]|nr:MAG: conserved exported protein of unknown function [Nitrosopumilales archaeon]